MEIVVRQGNGGTIPVDGINKCRNRIDSCILACMKSPVSGDHFVFIIFQGTGNDGHQDTLCENAPHQLFHSVIVFHLEGMLFKEGSFWICSCPACASLLLREGKCEVDYNDKE